MGLNNLELIKRPGNCLILMKHWLSQDVIAKRIRLIDEIIGILTASIVRMRREKSKRTAFARVRVPTRGTGAELPVVGMKVL